MSNITTVNNLVCSGNQTINGNIISNGNLQTINITSTNINNSNYNGSNYTISALMLFTLNQLNGLSIASQNYVNTQIASLVNSSPDLLNTLSE